MISEGFLGFSRNFKDLFERNVRILRISKDFEGFFERFFAFSRDS